MLRKLMIVSLVIGLCLMGLTPVLAQRTYPTLSDYEKITGKRIEKFNEAPSLKVKVAAGELPPVEERLPEEPMVVEPKEEIGQYGGSFKTSMMDPKIEGADTSTIHFQPLLRVSLDDLKPTPNIAKGWDFSNGGKTLTLYLRKGMKWSDGVPFTADDFLFWYEDILLNDELTPVKPQYWIAGEELVRVEKVDDYTVRFQFAVPYFPVINMLAVGREEPFRPAHYLKRYHTNYNPKANELAREEGYDKWWQCFSFHSNLGCTETRHDTKAPGLSSWVLTRIDTTGNKYFERNPYYFKVDTAGNQLPYVDRQIAYLLQNAEVVNLKAIAGEFTTSGVQIMLRDYPLFKKNEEKGGYHTLLWAGGKGSERLFSFNQTHKDPVLRKIFRNIRFKEAMSLAINREEISYIVYFGKGIPRQATTIPTTSFYEDWMGKYYAEYDPERANRLLDEMGLKWDKKHEYRLRSDGKPLAITLQYFPLGGEVGTTPSLVGEYWNKVGIKVAVKEVERSFYGTMVKTNEHDVAFGAMGMVSEFSMFIRPHRFLPPFTNAAVAWDNWYRTDGKKGQEPPEEIKRLYKIANEWQTTRPGTEEYLKLGKEIITIHLKNLFNIGTIGMPPMPLLIKNNLKNTPDQKMLNKPTWTWDYRFFLLFQPDQWFFSSQS